VVITVLMVVVGPAGPTMTMTISTAKVKPEATTAVVELVMMGVRTPKTC
jgi:hypothetical protein